MVGHKNVFIVYKVVKPPCALDLRLGHGDVEPGHARRGGGLVAVAVQPQACSPAVVV